MAAGARGEESATTRRGAGRATRALALVLRSLAMLVLAVGGLIAAATWLLRTEAGLQWMLDRVPGLSVQGARGRPDGGPMEAARVEWRSGTGRVQVIVEGLAWRDLRWQWRPHAQAWVGVELVEPRARRVQVLTRAGEAGPRAGPPAALPLPLALRLQDLRIERVEVNTLPALTALSADAHLGADGGRVHRVSRLAFRAPQADVRLSGSVGTAAPLALQAEAQASAPPGAAWPWSARLHADGRLSRFTLDAALKAASEAGLNVQATLAPFEPWPVEALTADTRALDLASLRPGWPATRLTGRAVAHTRGLDEPAHVELDLANALPGPWNEARLPMRNLRAEVAGRPREPGTLVLTALDAQLHGQAASVRGQGRWEASRLQLELGLDGVQPARLDGRLAPMTLGGPLRLTLHGLPSPDPRAARQGAVPLGGEIQGRLDGRLSDRPGTPPVRMELELAFEAAAGALRVDVARVDARAGNAHATLRGSLRREGAGRPWQVAARGELGGFDPAAWWPGAAGSAWRRGGHALNGSWSANLALPAPGRAAAGGAPAEGWRGVRGVHGEATVELRDSRLGGVPLQGRAALRATDQATTVDLALESGVNRLVLEGRAGRADGGDDRWRADVHAPALDALAPWAALAPRTAPWWPKAGALTGQARAQGRWPDLRTDGELRATGWHAEALRVARARAVWNLAAGQADAPLALDVEVDGLAAGVRRLERLRAVLDGSLQRHALRVRAASPARPPAWTAPLLGDDGPAEAGTTLDLTAHGAWERTGDGGFAWRASIGELAVAGWARARDVALEAGFDPRGRPMRVAVAPGRLELLGAVLRWREARWHGGAAPRLALDAELEPLRLAPWLARLHPQAGWGGDLEVRGRFAVDRGGRFDADLVLERTAGDLTLTDETGTRTLGLTDLRLALAAHGGTWHFTQGLAGANVGVLGGAQSVRVDPRAAWPPADTPLEGVLELRVADLGAWAPWVPPGWRLGGRLHTSAAIGGRFAAPEYVGEIVGSDLSVHNLLLGVEVQDGTLAVALRGPDATIERFRLRAGDGELQVTGGASFGDAPRADLTLKAERFRVLDRVDRRMVVSGDTQLALQARRVALAGMLVVDEGLIDISRADAPSLDADVAVRRPSAGAAPAAASPPAVPVLRNASVDLRIGLGEQLRLQGRGLDTRLRGELRVTTPDGRLAINGRVRAEGGTFHAYGERLQIERGVLFFAGPVEAPRLDVLAIRPNLDVRVGVAVSGTAVNPRVRLYSEPEMNDMEKLSWLVLGRESGGADRADAALLQRAALALVPGGGDGGTGGDALLGNLGLDELSVRQTEEAGVSDTVVTVGKRLSERWYVGYERGMAAAAGTWQLVYRAAQRLRLRAQGGAENALDVIWTWRWN